MLPIQQSTPFLPRRVETNSVQSGELLQVLQTSSIVKITNVQDKPSISTRLKQPKIESKQQQKEVLTSLLMIMLGNKTFTRFEDTMTDMKFFRASEKFYKLEILSATLRAESSLLYMKSRMAEIIALTKQNAKKEKIGDTKESMKLFVASYIKEGMNYHQLLNTLNSNKKNKMRGRAIFSKRSYAPRKAERAKIKWNKAEKKYNTTLTETGVHEHQILDYIIECFDNKAFMKAINQALSSTLSITDIENILRTVETAYEVRKQQATSLLTQFTQSSVLNASAIEDKTKFKAIRPPVNQALWHSLQKASSEENYINKFYEFVCTDWNDDCKSDKALQQDFRSINISKERYDILLQKCFRENLKLSAINLIYYIIQVKKVHSELKTAKGIEWNNKLKQRDESIRKILSTARKDFRKNFIFYQERKENPSQLTRDVLKRLKFKIDKTIMSYHQINNELNIDNDIVFINNILDFLTSKKNTDRADIINLIEQELISKSPEKKVNPELSAALGKRPRELSGESAQPRHKKSKVSKKIHLSQVRVQPRVQDDMLIDNREITSLASEASLEDEFHQLPNIQQALIFEQEPSASQNIRLNFESLTPIPQQAILQQKINSQDLEAEVLADLFPRLTDLFPTQASQNVPDTLMLPAFMQEPDCNEEEN